MVLDINSLKLNIMVLYLLYIEYHLNFILKIKINRNLIYFNLKQTFIYIYN